jgi:hypothetical protein
MGRKLGSALAIAAREAVLFCFEVPERGVVRLVDGMLLEHGPGASPDAIATIACREVLRDRGVTDEAAVRADVQRRGFRYAPLRLQQTDRTASADSGILPPVP